MTQSDKLDRLFDDLLFQTQRGGVTHEQMERGVRYEQFEQVKEWKLRYGFKFNIYGDEHLINGKAHFHFDKKEEHILCKVDFSGNILKETGSNTIPSKILKELKYFLSKEDNQKLIVELWNHKNPNLLIDYPTL